MNSGEFLGVPRRWQQRPSLWREARTLVSASSYEFSWDLSWDYFRILALILAKILLGVLAGIVLGFYKDF